MSRYYVYVHRDKNGKTFYVGKGCDKRAYYQDGRTAKWFEQANGGYWVEVIVQDLDESTALLVEQSLIKALNPGLANSSQVKEVVDPSRYLHSKVEENSIEIQKNKKKIEKIKKQLAKLTLTQKEREFINSPLATLPAKLISKEDLSLRGSIATKLKKQRDLQEKLGNIY